MIILFVIICFSIMISMVYILVVLHPIIQSITILSSIMRDTMLEIGAIITHGMMESLEVMCGMITSVLARTSFLVILEE